MNNKKIFYLLAMIIGLNVCLASAPVESNSESATPSEPVTLAAFNIRVLGRTKMSKPERVVDVVNARIKGLTIALIRIHTKPDKVEVNHSSHSPE